MGANIGTSSGATIGVQLDSQQGLFAGGRLTGKICLQVSKPVSAESVNLKFYGQEHSRVRYTKHVHSGTGKHRKTRVVHCTANQYHRFITIDSIVGMFPSGEVPVGQYEFPFLFDLPMGLPGSLPSRTKSGSYFTIGYFMEARLHRQGWLKWDVINHQEVFLMDFPRPNINIPSLLAPATTPVNFCCCFKRGEIVFLANVSDVQAQVGDTLVVNYSICNRSSAKIKGLDIMLRQTMQKKKQE